MKTKLLLALFILALSPVPCALSQIPQGFNYQAIVRNTSGLVIQSQPVKVKIEIQTSLTGGTVFWNEEHSITTTQFGMVSFVVGTGPNLTGTIPQFSKIDWNAQLLYIRTWVQYPVGSAYTEMGTTQIWSVPYALMAKDVEGPVGKLDIKPMETNNDSALFEVINKDGNTVFAVYNEGVRVHVSDDTKGKKGGFAVGSFGSDKAASQPYLMVTADSIRMYLDSNIATKKAKGGFAVGGFDMAKADVQPYLDVSKDSVRIYIDSNPLTKKPKGGFAVGGYDMSKATADEFFSVTSDSVKVSKSLLIPRLTLEERDNLPFTPGEALIIFNTTEGCMQIFKNDVWSNIWCFNCAPAFIIQPVDQTICSSQNAVFFVSATGTSLSFQWQQSIDNGVTWSNISNGGTNPVVSGAKSYTLSLTNIPVGCHNYKYHCVVSGSCLPNVTSNVATLNVGSTPPVITTQPTNQQLSVSCTASFSITSPGHSVSYKWQQSTDGGSNWTNISNGGTSPVYSGATAPILNLSNVPWSCNNYKYRCIISNLCGSDVTSTTATLTIAPSAILTHPSDQNLSTSCIASFNITTPSGFAISYKWQVSTDGGSTWSDIPNGGIGPVYTGATTANLSLSNVPSTCNNFKYRCVVSSLCGPNETSNSATLYLNQSPMISVQPSDMVVYAGYKISFNIVPSGSGINYQWQESTNGGSTWHDIVNGGSNPAYSEATTTTVTLTNVPSAYNNFKYRCAVSHYCRPNSLSDVATLSVPTPVPVSDVDGNTYNTVGIASQLWMAENLKTTKYRNGDLIGTTTPATLDITGETTPKYQWAYNNNESNVATYGRLYTWYAASDSRNICPDGWHLPTDSEWTILINYLINNGYAYDGTSYNRIAISLASTSLWTGSGATGVPGNTDYPAKRNVTGFTAYPSGFREITGAFSGLGSFSIFWSSTQYDASASWRRYLMWNYSGVNPDNVFNKYAHSVRCVKD